MLHRIFAIFAAGAIAMAHGIVAGSRNMAARRTRPQAPLARAIGLLALVVVGSTMTGQRASAQIIFGDLVLVCPQGKVTEPLFMDPKTGLTSRIVNSQVRAVAARACNPRLEGVENVNVSVTNSGANAIYVAFTLASGNAGPISWIAPCASVNNQVTIPPGQTCHATVPSSAGVTRFCAYTTLQSPAKANCFLAQSINQTMIETNFGANGSCYPSMSSCVWYDISVIPSSCTDQAWSANQCANTGGASYNLPVALACKNGPTYICRGPTSNQFGSAMYPSNCGNPNAACVPTNATPAPACDNAYFHPTPVPSPNAECQVGQTLSITFLPGP